MEGSQQLVKDTEGTAVLEVVHLTAVLEVVHLTEVLEAAHHTEVLEAAHLTEVLEAAHLTEVLEVMEARQMVVQAHKLPTATRQTLILTVAEAHQVVIRMVGVILVLTVVTNTELGQEELIQVALLQVIIRTTRIAAEVRLKAVILTEASLTAEVVDMVVALLTVVVTNQHLLTEGILPAVVHIRMAKPLDLLTAMVEIQQAVEGIRIAEVALTEITTPHSAAVAVLILTTRIIVRQQTVNQTLVKVELHLTLMTLPVLHLQRVTKTVSEDLQTETYTLRMAVLEAQQVLPRLTTVLQKRAMDLLAAQGQILTEQVIRMEMLQIRATDLLAAQDLILTEEATLMAVRKTQVFLVLTLTVQADLRAQ